MTENPDKVFSEEDDSVYTYNSHNNNNEEVEMQRFDHTNTACGTIITSKAKRYLSRSSFKKTNRESADVGGIGLVRKIYASAVNVPAIYTEHKHSEYVHGVKVKYVLRKIAGIPFAIGYYFLLIWIISTLILNKTTSVVDDDFSPGLDAARNICDVIFSNGTQENNTTTSTTSEKPIVGNMVSNLKNIQNASQFEKEYEHNGVSDVIKDLKDTSPSPVWLFNVNNSSSKENGNQTTPEDGMGVLFENDFLELHIVVGGIMGIISVISIFSRNVRATMLLLLPGLITNRSRHVIFTVVLGILSRAPVNNIRLNFIKLLENSICMYRSVIAMSCVKEREGNFILKYARDTHSSLTQLYDIIEKIRCQTFPGPSCKSEGFAPFPFPNSTFDNLKSITAPSTQGIKAQATVVMVQAGEFGGYIEIARKSLTIISIVLLIVDANRYLRLYYIDSSFDNIYVGLSTRRLWKRKNYYKDKEVIKNHLFAAWDKKNGLRNWEKKQGFKTLNLPKLSKMLFYKLFRNSFTTVAFTAFVLIVFLADEFLEQALLTIKESQNFHVTLEGYTEAITASINADLQGYNTKSCLASPHYTSGSDTFLIFFLLFLAMLSCVLQVFMGGLRAKLCSLFYPDRVEERADYLYFRIFNGRINRKRELMLIIRREVEKREKLIRFSPLQRLKEHFRFLNFLSNKKMICPGCKYAVKKRKSQRLSLSTVGKETMVEICEDCHLDLSSRDINSCDEHSSLSDY